MAKAKPLSSECSGCGMNGGATGWIRVTGHSSIGSASIGMLQSGGQLDGGGISGRQTTKMLRIGSDWIRNGHASRSCQSLFLVVVGGDKL